MPSMGEGREKGEAVGMGGGWMDNPGQKRYASPKKHLTGSCVTLGT